MKYVATGKIGRTFAAESAISYRSPSREHAPDARGDALGSDLGDRGVAPSLGLGAVGRGQALFTVAGQEVYCIDSPAKHAFSFTPSVSFFVECESEAELDTAFDQLSANGAVLMPKASYGFSRKFAWVNDRYGVSWQLNWH